MVATKFKNQILLYSNMCTISLNCFDFHLENPSELSIGQNNVMDASQSFNSYIGQIKEALHAQHL